MSSRTSGTPQPSDGNVADEAYQQAMQERKAMAYFEKFQQPVMQELLGWHKNHWLLSEDFKMAYDQPVGLIKGLNPKSSNSCVILIEEDPELAASNFCLDYREVHQIVKELTYGIFVLNQTPTISLEALYDQGTACQLPPAYVDTRIGQLLIAVDYMMKGLWHGAYFPKDKRTKFNDRWRESFRISKVNGKPEKERQFLVEFIGQGLQDMGKDPDYGGAYDDLPFDIDDDPEMLKERNHFMKYSEELCMQMVFYQKSVSQYRDLYVMDAEWQVSSIVRLLDDKINHDDYERINTRLQLHEKMIEANLEKKHEVRRNIFLLKIVSFLTPFLVGMRKRMKIPEMTRFLPDMTEDQCKTEEELPPLMLGEDFKCKNFTPEKNKYFHLHGGILIDLETDDIVPAKGEFEEKYEEIVSHAEKTVMKYLGLETLKEHYEVPKATVNGKEYYVIRLEFETFFHPKQPIWIEKWNERLKELEKKHMSIGETLISDQFIRHFGKKKTTKLKAQMNSPKACAIRGLVIIFVQLCRKMLGQQLSRLSKQDEQGLSLLHHAAMNNRPQIIVSLLRQTVDINARRNNILSTGPTALHIASRCGALDAAACLLACCASPSLFDQDGWAAIHHAAFFDHQAIVKLMARRNPTVVELLTKNDLRSTPLLLAASSGALSVVKCLIILGADIARLDGDGNGMVNLAALRFHTNILEHLIEWNNDKVPVWRILVKMLKDKDIDKKDSAVKCLEVLSTSKPQHWKSILEADGVTALVKLLHLDNEVIQAVAASVIVNISEQEEVRVALTKADAAPILVTLLGSPDDNIQSRAAIILSDIASLDGNQEMIAQQGGIAPIINLLDSEMEDVLVNAVNAIRVLCQGNSYNQDAVAENGGIIFFKEFLTLKSEILKATTAAAIAAIAAGNHKNQDALLEAGVIEPLVTELIVKSSNETVQVKAANAVEALAQDNPRCQKEFLNKKAPKALLKLLKNFNVEVREQAASALWALAGNTNMQQKVIAEKTTIPNICSMLLDSTEKLLQVGCMMAIALGRENIENQIKLAQADAFQQLVRLLRTQKDSPQVLLMVIQVLGILCVGVAYTNNKITQWKIAEEGAIPLLVKLLNAPPSEEVHVEVAISLGCIVLSNPRNQEILQEDKGFHFDVLLDLLKSNNEAIRLRAGMALTIFAFNNTPQQYAIREAGGIKYSVFEPFINSLNEFDVCYAAFQIVVLARVIVDEDQVVLTARGVTYLVEKLHSRDDNVIVLAASLLSSLAHTRAGIPDAMVTTGALDVLIERLSSDNEQVKSACAVALGYLTFNKTAARILFGACRNDPDLYKDLMKNIGKNPRISQDFVQDFKRAKLVGLPSQCLESRGGHPIIPPSRNSLRPLTGHSQRSSVSNRVKSAPARRDMGSGRKSSQPSLPVSTPASSRPSSSTTQQFHSTPKVRPQTSAPTRSRKITHSPEHTHKSSLSAWKEEI